MSDIALLSTADALPKSWHILHQAYDRQLAILDEPGPHPLRVQTRNHIVMAMLSQTHMPNDVFDAIRIYRERFIEHIGVSAGIIWCPDSHEFCVFRDPFGFIPILSGNALFTTSPVLQERLNANQPLNDAWFDRFAECRDDTSRDDVFQNTERIRPGEALYVTRTGIQSFLDEVVSDTPNLTAGNLSTDHFCLWINRHYETSTDCEAELTCALRHQIIDAASRIPCSRPLFTLSGGLDSTGILAGYHQKHTETHDTISLVSGHHASCDESHELDILADHFPLNQFRYSMDDAWPLSKPELYRQFRAYGPLCSPGIESTLSIYHAAYEHFGPRTIITGYGGNYLVKVRQEALWRDMISGRRLYGMLSEMAKMRPQKLRSISGRVLGNVFGGRIRDAWHFIQNPRNSLTSQVLPEVPRTWFNPQFSAQFPAERVDPVFALSHTQERAWLPLTWDWEYSVRALDTAARLTHHQFYDPLFDLKLYDFCATIPPQYFMYAGDYRRIYRNALAPMLPKAIASHPKCQCYDALMHEGLAQKARPLLEKAIAKENDFFDTSKLIQAYTRYIEDAASGEPDYPLIYLWRSLSVCLWL